MGKSQEDDNVSVSESARVSNNVRTVILALFALIGFIILVFAVFTASVGAQLVEFDLQIAFLLQL